MKKSGRMLDTQKYFECQLVSVINAAVALGDPGVDPDSAEYERLVDLVRARHGGALEISSAVDYFGLLAHPILPVRLEELRIQALGQRPVSVDVRHPEMGFHSVLMTNAEHGSVRLWNFFDRKTRVMEGVKRGKPGRLSWERLMEYVNGMPAHCRSAKWYELDPAKHHPWRKKAE